MTAFTQFPVHTRSGLQRQAPIAAKVGPDSVSRHFGAVRAGPFLATRRRSM
jgi:hypothetical protein